MKIRKASAGDAEKLVILLTHFETGTRTRLPKQLLQIRAYKNTAEAIRNKVEELFSNQKCFTFIAEERDQSAGFIFGEIKEKKEKVYDKEGYVDSWYVEPEYREAGTGKLLFDSLVEEFKKADCTHIALSVHFDNTKAIQIYERMDFTKRVISFIKPLKDLNIKPEEI